MKNKTTLTIVIISIFLSSCSSFTGKKTINWDTGNVAIEGEYKDNLKNGVWSFYCPNGELYNKSEFKDGLKISDCVYSFSRPGTWIKDNYIQKSYVKSTYANDLYTNRITSSQLFINDKLKIKITFAVKNINEGEGNYDCVDSILIYDRNLLKTDNNKYKRELYSRNLNNGNSLNIGKLFLTSNTIMDELIDYITSRSSIIDFNKLKNRKEEFKSDFCGLQFDTKNPIIISQIKNGFEDENSFCHHYPDSPLDSIVDFYDLFQDETFIDNGKMGAIEGMQHVSVVDFMSNIDYGVHDVYGALILAAELKE